jgi:magnesium transporter
MVSGQAMETTTRLLLPDVSDALRTDPSLVVEMLEELHPADLADLAAALDDELALKLIRALPIEEGARLLEALDEDKRNTLAAALAAADQPAMAELVEEMAPDDAADLVADLPEETRAALLTELPQEDQRDIKQLLAYPDGTAGALMTTNFVTVGEADTVSEAIEAIRRDAEEMETINYAYAVDSHGTLLGVLSLRDLVLAKGDKKIAEVMEANVIAVSDTEEQAEVVRMATKYDLIAVPVIDRSRRFVGIITVDDVVDVIEEEATKDAQQMGAVAPLEHSYFQTSFWGFVAKRAPWLVFLFIAGFLTSAAMKALTDDFERIAALLWFVPLIISSGGNAGSQSATLMIRALAVDEVQPRDFAKVIGRELGMGLALGLILGVFGVGRAMAWDATRTFAMVGTVSLSIVCVVTIGSTLGAGLPLLLKRLRLDPAVSSTPFIASLSDVLGLLVYYEIASLLVP